MTTVLRTSCCIAGGGPAGMVLGTVLARAGVDVIVLEKHADFLRDFRGDTVHPSTLDVLAELGWLDDLLACPHQELRELRGIIGTAEVTVADVSHVAARNRFIAFMPQWDFLDVLARRGRAYPGFRLFMQSPVDELIVERRRVVGLRAHAPGGPFEVRADLVVAADGRHSRVRELARLAVRDFGAPIDVLWLRLPRHAVDGAPALGRFTAGRALVTIDRGAYWQCGYVIAKGGYDALRARGIGALRAELATVAPFLADRVDVLRDWDDVHLLAVQVDRLRRWYRPGLLCIGDAAHAMSPLGGVGINLAVQDAVAAANVLAVPLRRGTLRTRDLARIERRRMFPTRVTQALQVIGGRTIATRVLGAPAAGSAARRPLPVALLQRFPALRRIAGQLIGVGIRPEHVRTPDVAAV